MVREMFEYLHQICVHDAQTKGLQALLNYPDDFQFDLIAFDINSGHCLFPLTDKFGNPPIIGLTPFGLQHYFSQIFGNQIPFYPFFMTKTTYDKLSLFERLIHHVNVILLVAYYNLLFLPAEYQVAKNIFKEVNIQPLDVYQRRLKLLLTNTDPIWDFSMPHTPNIIPVGGIHIKEAKKLPNNLQKFLDEEKNGFIYFAFGTNVKPETLTKLNDIIRVLKKLPYKILWKINSKNLNVSLPKNVITKDWWLQNDILGIYKFSNN